MHFDAEMIGIFTVVEAEVQTSCNIVWGIRFTGLICLERA
jgi:hypothetical protein